MGYGDTARVAEEIDWNETNDRGANAPITETHAAEVGRRHSVVFIDVVVAGAALGNDVTIELLEGATVRWRTKLGQGLARGERGGIVFQRPVKMGVAQAAAVSVSAGGAGVVITVNIGGYTI